MGYFNTQIITEVGLEMLARGSAGQSNVVFTKLKTGDGEYSVKEIASLKKAKSLKNERQGFYISSIRTESKTICVRATITNKELAESYFIKEVGVFAKEDNGEEKLLAISICQDNPTLLPQFDTMPIEIPITNYIAYSGDGNYEIVYRSDVYASAAELHEQEERFNAYVEDEEAEFLDIRELIKSKQNISNGNILKDDNWNNFIIAGAYWVQNATMDDIHHAPTKEHAFGILYVINIEYPDEKRILQIYFPHVTTISSMWIRMLNGDTWNDWIAANEKTLPISKGGTGKTTGKDAADALINSLPVGTSSPIDDDYFISQYVGGGEEVPAYYRRTVLTLWKYIKNKITSDTFTSPIKTLATVIVNSADNGSTNFAGGTSISKGANLILRGAEQSEMKGLFELTARNLKSAATLKGAPDGTLNWASNVLIKKVSTDANRAFYLGCIESSPKLLFRSFTNVFQIFPDKTYSSTYGVNIGHSGYRFGDAYFTNVYNTSGVITTSDRNKKHNIKEISKGLSEKIIDGLIPSSFQFNDGSSGRTHYGIIAQDLEKLLKSLGISPDNFAPLVKEYPDKLVKIENPDYNPDDDESERYISCVEKDYDKEPTYNVRYEEFIMILVKYCQGLKEENESMQSRLSVLEDTVTKILKKIDL